MMDFTPGGINRPPGGIARHPAPVGQVPRQKKQQVFSRSDFTIKPKAADAFSQIDKFNLTAHKSTLQCN